ncbi:hypothetical protein HMPREF9525_01077 [Enterococcus faecium TX0133a04]|uniref:DUF4355 domain-containing protein n=1 Tax=Enterococcus faecium TaxID=1352 RepID=UPI0001EB760D|nr:DUF4355 domain-containing protein [Enterococcus faecium]EFR67528.1 hypothetical protein HMPREF9524_02342 [Enterococcus faecium TX0133a01]EFR69886.1 hypothetical protein HMPREF9526_03104 [Enterococcus faecium TX0133B]EFR73070.1 hypothetical protein HMPREF9523_03043 [Enterococcus faecium TX0133A]EFR79144.1 hypothetical protein HMPREF9527_00012 [Enterococcus faecium TX0133C]EFS06821.1 hypothetical protein HMPREF9525_01077 [Enterococcus faecium TX0133a04]
MKKRLFMPMNLQFFSEPGDGGSGDEGQQGNLPAGSQETPTEVKEENNTGKTFSRDEVAKMIAAETNKAKAAWEKELAAKKEEAKKLAKMNAEEKLQHELEQKEAEIAELKRNQTLSEMKSEASKMLSSASLPQDDELLGLIVSEDAEATKKAVSIITKFASQIKKENARQSTPGEGGQFTADKETKQTVANLAAKNRIIK